MNTPLSQILEELAMFAVESDADGRKYEYSDHDFVNTTHLFMHVLGTKAFDLGKMEDIPFEIMEKQSEKMGNELAEFIKKWTDFDTKTFYSKHSPNNPNNR